MGSIPSQDTCLGCGFGPQWGRLQEATDPLDVSYVDVLSLSPYLPLSLKSISMSSGEDNND